MNKRMIVPRVSSDETTFAVIEWSGVPRQELFHRVKRAVTEWVRTTEAGRIEYENSSEDLNLGDLSNCDDDPALVALLTANGITHFDVEVYSDSDYPGIWTYDSQLVESED